MSMDEKKKRLLDKASNVSEAAVMLALKQDYEDSLNAFGELEGKFSSQDLDAIIQNAPMVVYLRDEVGKRIKDPDWEQGSDLPKYLTTTRTYDDLMSAAEVMTFASKDDADLILYSAIYRFREDLDIVREKPWVRELNITAVNDILLKDLRSFVNALMRAERSHTRYGKMTFGDAVRSLAMKKIIPIESKTLAVVERGKGSEEYGDQSGDQKEDNEDNEESG